MCRKKLLSFIAMYCMVISPVLFLAGSLFAVEQLPSAITSLSASIGTAKGQVNLTWKAPYEDSTQGGPVALYVIKSASFNITGISSSTANADPYIYEYAQSIVPADPGNTETLTLTAPLSFASMGVGTTFWFVIFSRDSAGLYSYPSTVQASTRTYESLPPAQIVDLAASAQPYKGEIKLTWTATGSDGTAGTAVRYMVRFGTFPVSEISDPPLNAATFYWFDTIATSPEGILGEYTTSYFSWAPKVSGSAESRIISSLPIGTGIPNGTTTFWFAIVAQDQYTTSSTISNIALGTTLPNITANGPTQITGLTAATTSFAGGIILSWFAPGDDPTPTTRAAVKYVLRFASCPVINSNFGDWGVVTEYDQTESGTKKAWVPAAPGTLEVKNLIGFNPGATYYFGMKDDDEYGNRSIVSTGDITGTYAGPLALISAIKVNKTNGDPVYLGQRFSVEGVVVSTYYQTNSVATYIFDDTPGVQSGINAFQIATTYKMGDRVRVKNAVLGIFNGALQLGQFSGTESELISTKNPIPAPLVVTCSSFCNSTDGNDGGELYEAKIVRLNNVSLTATRNKFDSGWKTETIQDNTGSTAIYYYYDTGVKGYGTDVGGSPAPKGKFDLMGIGSQYDTTSGVIRNPPVEYAPPYLTGYQVLVRTTRDIIDVVDDLVVLQDSSSLTLKWTDSNDPDRIGYNIYWSSVSASTCYSTVISTTVKGALKGTINCAVSPLINDVTYWFYITLLQGGTVQNEQAESSASNTVTEFPRNNPVFDILSPGAITTFAAEPLTVGGSNGGKISLTWIAPYGDGTFGSKAEKYILKYATFGPITEENFELKTDYPVTWTPSAPGIQETQILAGLGHGLTYYFCMKSADKYNNVSSTSNSVNTYSTPYPVMSIADARSQAAGTVVAVKGVVTDWYNNTASFGFLIQDETGGIDVYSPPVELQNTATGYEYLVVGTRADFNGLKEIDGTKGTMAYSLIGTGRPVTISTITCNDLITNIESYEGKLIRIVNVNMATADDTFPDGPNIINKSLEITDDGIKKVSLFVHKQVDMGSFTLKKVSGKFNVRGTGFRDTSKTSLVMIRPRNQFDMEADATLPLAVQWVTAGHTTTGEGGILLSWPAPTDPADLLHGNAAVSKYEIRYSVNPQSLYSAASTWWDAANVLTRVTPSDSSSKAIGSTVAVSNIIPLSPGAIEWYIAMYPDVNLGSRYYFGIKSYDSALNVSTISIVTDIPAQMYVNGLKIGKTDLGDRMTVFSSGTYVTHRYVVFYGDAEDGIAPTISASANWTRPNVPVSIIGYPAGRTGVFAQSMIPGVAVISAQGVTGTTITTTMSNALGGLNPVEIPIASKYESIDIVTTVYGVFTYTMTRWNDISAPPVPDSTKFVAIPRTTGSNDQDKIEGNAGAIEPYSTVIIYGKDPVLLTTKALKDLYTINKTTALADGSFPTTDVGFSQYARLYIVAKDPAGNKGLYAFALLPILETKFFQPGPNPFKPVTGTDRGTLWFDLKDSQKVTIKIFNVAGEYITNKFWANSALTSYDELPLTSGGNNKATANISRGFMSDQKGTSWSPQWDGKNDAGNDVASGVYIIYFKAGDYETTKKIVLIR